MRIMPVVVGALSVVLGAGIVLVFNKPVPKKHAPPSSAGPAVQPELEARSARVAIPSNGTSRVEGKEIKRTLAPDGVESRIAKLNSDGVEALDAGLFMKAVELFEQCRAAAPNEPVFASNLAEAYARLATSEFDADVEDRRRRAIEHMTKAVDLAPQREDLRRRLDQMRNLAKSEEGMWTDETEHFQLSYDGARSELLGGASVLTNALESAYQQFGELFGSYPVEAGRPKVRVVLYRRDGFHEATGMGHWAGGLYDGTVRVPVDDLKREKSALTRVLRHELTHAFVHAGGGAGVPGWLNEGLAQRLEFDSMAHAQTTLENARRGLHGVELIPLSALSGALGDLKDEAKIAQAYRQALAFVGWIETQYGDLIPYQLVAGQKAGGVAKAFMKATGVDLDTAWTTFAEGL
jgi:tetratricopeptide (TPR) repeat protein